MMAEAVQRFRVRGSEVQVSRLGFRGVWGVAFRVCRLQSCVGLNLTSLTQGLGKGLA